MIRTYLSFELDDGRAEQLVSLFRDHRILEISVAQRGCHSAELTVSTDESHAIVTATWDNPEAYARWTSRSDRGRLSAEISRLLTVPIDAATKGSEYRIAHIAQPDHREHPLEREDQRQ